MTKILHLTHGGNLESIINNGGLWSKNHRPAEVNLSVDISHGNIQERRARKLVPCEPRGNLHDYVPFYFGARSPMLYVNHAGGVSSNPHGQRALIYLVASAEETAAAGERFVFTDGHAEMGLAAFFDDLSELNQLDWEAIHAQRWTDTPDEPTRRFHKQAEFLVHRFFPLNLVREIVVLNARICGRVEEILSQAGVVRPVTINQGWYYEGAS